MSRFAAAPFTRLKGLLRSDPAAVEPAAVDHATTSPDIASPVVETPVTIDQAPVAAEACADVAAEPSPEIKAASAIEVADSQPIADTPVTSDQPAVVLKTPIVLDDAADETAEVATESLPADAAKTEVLGVASDPEPATADAPVDTPSDAAIVRTAEIVVEDASDALAELQHDPVAADAEIAVSSEIAAVENVTIDEPSATHDETVLILDTPITLQDSIAAPDEPAQVSSAVSAEAATESEPPAAIAALSEPTKPEQPAPKPAPAEDRATLIRRRWSETGIRMWNPRLHGTGESLSIQGQVALLPPEPGESLPRYDRLEFRLLGGQIICEGIILDAPVHAAQRNFTRLAEPQADRAREKPAERQAVLA